VEVCVDFVMLLQMLVAAYGDAGLSCGQELLPPADRADAIQVFTSLDLPLADDLVAIWGVFGGQGYIDASAGTTGLFGQHRLLSPSEAVDEYRFLLTEVYPSIGEEQPYPPERGVECEWVPGLLPFAQWDAYRLCVDCATGVVWNYYPYEGLSTRAESIQTLLQTLLSQAPFDDQDDEYLELVIGEPWL
jgi:hypothetical protein